jgi:glycosyltransferase involved in cell wall biosynthesis
MIVFIDENIFEKQEYGGISRYFCELAKAISETPEHQILIYGGWSKNTYLSQLRQTNNLRVIKIGSKGAWLRSIKRWFNPIFRKAIFLSLRLKGQKIVYHPSYFSLDSFIHKHCDTSALTVHDLIYEHQEKNKYSKKVARRKKVQELVDHIIVVSESTAHDLSRFNPAVANKISVIHLAATPPATSPTQKEKRDNTFVFVGNRGDYKNGALAIEALHLLQQDIDAKILFVGGGGFNDEENDLINKTRLKNHVAQRNLSDTELSQAYQSSAALLFPSSYEGFGLPPLEAMQHDCPVIAQHVSSIPEVLGEWGTYLPDTTAEGLRALMLKTIQQNETEDSQERKHYRAVKLNQFSWKKTANKTISVYDENQSIKRRLIN